MNTQRFTRDLKLIKTDEFSSVFSFRKRYHSEFFVCHYLPKQQANARIGLVTGKKIQKSAVKRNYMRRVLKELFRKNPTLRALPVDLVFRIQKSFNKTQYQQVEESFEQLVRKLKVQYLPK